jgi:hypothetical protein
MMTHEAHEGRPPADRPWPHQLLPIAGITAVVVAVLAHLAGGAALVHLGLGGGLAYFGVDVASLGGSPLAIGLAAVIVIKLLVVFGARRWLRHR